jgi:hypothetical protein
MFVFFVIDSLEGTVSKAWQSVLWCNFQAENCKRCFYHFVNDVCIPNLIPANVLAMRSAGLKVLNFQICTDRQGVNGLKFV